MSGCSTAGWRRRFRRSLRCRRSASSPTARTCASPAALCWPPWTRATYLRVASRAGASCRPRRSRWRCGRARGCVRAVAPSSAVEVDAQGRGSTSLTQRRPGAARGVRSLAAPLLAPGADVVFLDRTEPLPARRDGARASAGRSRCRGGCLRARGRPRRVRRLRRVRRAQGRRSRPSRTRVGAIAEARSSSAEPTVWLDHSLLRRLGLVAGDVAGTVAAETEELHRQVRCTAVTDRRSPSPIAA